MSTGRLSCILLLLALAASISSCTSREPSAHWFKGNIHTHSLWSDGDDFPEMIVDWYREHDYDFVALSDHNTLAEGEKWVKAGDLAAGARDRYTLRFGSEWIDTRVADGDTLVRLKTLQEYRPILEEAGRFLIIQAEEITDHFETKPVHVNATNLEEVIPPSGGTSVLDVMQRNVDAVLEQRRTTGRPMIPHINHPNFGWAVRAEDIAALEGERFFEVYNGHPAVHNAGDSTHIGTDAMWDVILTERLLHGRNVLYGLAVDDAHNYHDRAPNLSDPGRGWIQVRSSVLNPDSLILAMERGDFYASTGVTLRDVRATRQELVVEIIPDDGVSYRTDFIGTTTRRDARLTPGRTLASVDGSSARYTFSGNELYVRARITSDRPKSDPVFEGEVEAAWVQPVLP